MNELKTYDKVESPVIGEKYHLAWAFKSCAFRLMEIKGDTAVLKADRRRKTVTAKLSELQYTKHSARRAEQLTTA